MQVEDIQFGANTAGSVSIDCGEVIRPASDFGPGVNVNYLTNGPATNKLGPGLQQSLADMGVGVIRYCCPQASLLPLNRPFSKPRLFKRISLTTDANHFRRDIKSIERDRSL